MSVSCIRHKVLLWLIAAEESSCISLHPNKFIEEVGVCVPPSILLLIYVTSRLWILSPDTQEEWIIGWWNKSQLWRAIYILHSHPVYAYISQYQFIAGGPYIRISNTLPKYVMKWQISQMPCWAVRESAAIDGKLQVKNCFPPHKQD